MTLQRQGLIHLPNSHLVNQRKPSSDQSYLVNKEQFIITIDTYIILDDHVYSLVFLCYDTGRLEWELRKREGSLEPR